jgi:two-component system chemotaxis response regulator CheY
MDVSLPVLVVDDFRSMSAIISRLVRDLGFRDVDQGSDGTSALEGLQKRKYGLILSDWDMRPMNGAELVRRIRRDPTHSDTRIIMVTAVGDAGGSWKAGADGYLMKPFKLDDLKDRIAEVLSQRADVTATVG